MQENIIVSDMKNEIQRVDPTLLYKPVLFGGSYITVKHYVENEYPKYSDGSDKERVIAELASRAAKAEVEYFEKIVGPVISSHPEYYNKVDLFGRQMSFVDYLREMPFYNLTEKGIIVGSEIRSYEEEYQDFIANVEMVNENDEEIAIRKNTVGEIVHKFGEQFNSFYNNYFVVDEEFLSTINGIIQGESFNQDYINGDVKSKVEAACRKSVLNTKRTIVMTFLEDVIKKNDGDLNIIFDNETFMSRLKGSFIEEIPNFEEEYSNGILAYKVENEYKKSVIHKDDRTEVEKVEEMDVINKDVVVVPSLLNLSTAETDAVLEGLNRSMDVIRLGGDDDEEVVADDNEEEVEVQLNKAALRAK